MSRGAYHPRWSVCLWSKANDGTSMESSVETVFEYINEIHLEVTRQCNLACSYCYSSENSVGAPLMSSSLALDAVDQILRNTRHKNVDLIFHGGEPLLAPVSWYEEVMSGLVRGADKLHKRVRLLMQTNATLATDNVVGVLTRHKVDVSTSLDGPPEINDLARSHGARALEGILRLQGAGILSGLIVTVTQTNAARINEVLEFLCAHQLRKIKVNVVRRLGKAGEVVHLEPDLILQMRLEILNKMLKVPPEISESNMLRVLHKFLNPRTAESLCRLACDQPFCHAGIQTVIVDALGRLFPCGLSCDVPGTCLGCLERIDIDSYMSVLEQFHRKSPRYADVCPESTGAQICTFGCSVEGELSEEECQVNRDLMAHLQAYETSVLWAGFNRLRNRRPVELVPARL